ncbi:hypothetical protein, partial [Salmonella enterica]
MWINTTDRAFAAERPACLLGEHRMYKGIISTYVRVGVLLSAMLFDCSVNAKNLTSCRLPPADMFDPSATIENLHGIVSHVDIVAKKVVLRMSSERTVTFTIDENTLYIGEYGGDFDMEDLVSFKGKEAWVWYKNCDIKNKNEPIVLINFL